MKVLRNKCVLLFPLTWLLSCASEATNVEQFALGPTHSCALLTDGTVKCWGSRGAGALSDGTPVGPGFPDAQLSAVNVQGLSTAVSQIAVGGNTTCALLKTGAVQCWGAPVATGLSEVLDAVLTPPTTIPGLEANVQALAANWATACALKDDGSVWCWGEYSTQADRGAPPVSVALPLAARLIAVGYANVCAALVDHSVWCWGDGSDTFFNQPAVDASLTPTQIGALPNVEWRALGVGSQYGCALASNGVLYCWGQSPQINSSAFASYESAAVDLGAPVEQMSLGDEHACAIVKGGGMRCWGVGYWGTLGLGGVTQRDCTASYAACSPGTVTPAGLGPVRRMDAGPYTTCAEQTDGEVLCWGGNHTGAVGNGTRWDAYQPTPVLGL